MCLNALCGAAEVDDGITNAMPPDESSRLLPKEGLRRLLTQLVAELFRH